MEARFRIRTREGEELAPRTVEIFSELVRSGVVRPHDLVFDALTGEWAPASVHPMVRLFQDPLVVDPTAESVGRRLAEEGAVVPADSLLAIELVEPDPVSPDEEARAFIAKMEEERRSDPDTTALSREVPLVHQEGGSVVGLVPARPARPASMPGRDRFAATERSEAAPVEAARRSGAGVRRPPNRGLLNAAILSGAAVALALSLLWPPGGGEDATEGGVVQAGVAAPARPVPMTEEQTRATAFAAYLEAVDALREELGVGEVPRMWLEGRYLADPGAYPEVRRYWQRYLGFVDAVRAAEVPLYRGAYLTAAADAGLSGPVRSLRLAAAQEVFAASKARRDELYARVEGLARAALALDDLLSGMEGRVTYEPITGPRVSADPIIEAAGSDPETQARLEAALDRVLAVLQGPGGVPTRDRAGVPGWMVAGLKEVEQGR